MKNRYRLKFAFDNMLLHAKQMLACVILYIITLLLFAVIIVMNKMTGGFREDVQAALKNDVSRLGYVSMDGNYDYENQSAFIEYVRQLDGIETIGAWNIGINQENNFSFLAAIQKSNKQNLDGEIPSDDYLEIIYMGMDAWNLFGFDLCEGIPPDENGNFDTTIFLYLGYQYRDALNIGDILTSDNGNYTYKVAGFFDQGETIAVNDLYLLDKFYLYSACSLDYAVIAVAEEDFVSGFYFSVSDGYSYDEVEKNIMILAENAHTYAALYKIDAVLTAAEKSLKPVNAYLIQLFIVVGFTACIVLTCYQTMNIIMRKSEYGIMYASGISTKDLLYMIVFENVIKMVISIIIMLPILTWMALKFFMVSYSAGYIIRRVIAQNVIVMSMIVGIIITGLSSIIPILTIKRYSPVELIGGSKTC